MNEPIISVSGLRGVVGDSLTPEIAIRYSCAFAAELPAGPIVITRDGRTTGPMLAAALKSGLSAVGRGVIDADLAATPTTGVLVRAFHAAGGIQISASHNPPQYNGLKLFSAAGRVIPEADGAAVIQRYRKSSPAWVTHEGLGKVIACDDTISMHLELVLATVDVDAIRKRRFKVLLDSNRGAGGLLGKALLSALGCTTIVLGEQADGLFEHTPEPTAENLATVLGQVPKQGCDVGFCQDPDADRLAVIDERGRYIGEEYTLALCVDYRLKQKLGPIVTNCSTSRMSQDLADKFGVPLVRSAVGEANVVDQMLAHDAVLGGEGNGGVIDPRVGLVRDSFVGMAQILDALAQGSATVGQLADQLPRYEIVKTKFALDRAQIPAALVAIAQQFSSARQDRLDGLRLDFPDAWLLVRASNTEPIVRAIAEAKTADLAHRLCKEAQSAAGIL